MKFDLSKIEFSRPDIKRGVKLPKKLTSELAELMGIIIGDGHINIRKPITKKYKRLYYEIRISGHWTEDMPYHLWIKNLFKKIFNVKLNIKEERKNAIKSSLDSKAIVNFMSKNLLISLGNKDNLKLPKHIIKQNRKEIISSFLRGLADTDFSLTFKKKHKKVHYYPIIQAGFKNDKIIKFIEVILQKLKIKYFCGYDNKYYDKRINKYQITHWINISGKKNLKIWMNLIGFNNPKHLTKYQIWKKFGFCPPYTNIIERRKILKGEINPYSYYTGRMAKR